MGETWIPSDTFGARLRLVRHELGVSVEDISARCGVHPATWSTWERGRLPRGMNRIVAIIAATVDVDRDWLMWGGDLARSTRWYCAPSVVTAA